MQSESASNPQWLITGFKIVPLCFSVLIDIAGYGFASRWGSIANEYFGAKDIDWARDDIEWHYRHISVYLYDFYKSKYSLTLSLVYVSVVLVIELFQSRVVWAVILVVVSLLLALFWWETVEKWFRIDSDERDPDRYYNDYYSDQETGDRIYEPFFNYLPRSISRRINPRRISIGSEMVLIVAVVLLDLFSVPLNLQAVGSLLLVVLALIVSLYL